MIYTQPAETNTTDTLIKHADTVLATPESAGLRDADTCVCVCAGTRRLPWANRYLALGGKEEASLRQTTMISLPDTLPPLGVPLQYLFFFPPPLPNSLHHKLSLPLSSSIFPSCHLLRPPRIHLPPSSRRSFTAAQAGMTASVPPTSPASSESVDKWGGCLRRCAGVGLLYSRHFLLARGNAATPVISQSEPDTQEEAGVREEGETTCG